MADTFAEGDGHGLFAPVASAELPEIKLFGKWSTDDVQVSDISLTVSTNKSTTFGVFLAFRWCKAVVSHR